MLAAEKEEKSCGGGRWKRRSIKKKMKFRLHIDNFLYRGVDKIRYGGRNENWETKGRKIALPLLLPYRPYMLLNHSELPH